MESGQGMVAVVRGLGDSQLAVTVLDSGKQYTLLPTSVLQPTNQQDERSSSTNTPNQQYQPYHQSQCHVAAQATDGHYTSVYKATHCKVRPTSPPIQLTEFPPQRASVAPGEGNFEVGGTGSGDTSFNFLRTNGAYRGGGMVWPDRGCVCSPRPSREPDAFAESLRKYPSMSPERSAEIVERLISYTQGKNFKVLRQSSLSPTRLPAEQNDRSSHASSRCKACELEKTRYRFQGESPTKDKPRRTERLDSDGESRRTFTKSYDVRYVKDMSRKVKEGTRNNPYTAQCPSIREAFEIMNDHAAASQKSASYGVSGNVFTPVAPLMVHSQTQAAASMACKEVSTESRHKMFSRNVAVPLSPPSDVSRPPEGAVFDPRPPLLQASVQTLVIPLPVTVRKSVQTTQSSINISNVRTSQNSKKCRSEMELSNREVREEILGWLINVLHSTYSKKLRADVIEELKEKMKNISNDFGGEEAKVTLKVENIEDDCQNNLENICDELVNKMRIKNRYLTQIYRAEVVPYRAPENFKKAIKDWLLELPMRTRNYCGKHIDEEQMLANFVKRLKKALFSPDYDTKILRNEIVRILQDIPIEYGSTNPNVYLNRLANNLIKKLLNTNGFFNKNKTTKSEVENKTKQKKFRPNENEIRDFVRDEMIEFLDKFDIKISLERLQNLETDILGRIVEFLNNVHSNDDERFINDVAHALQGIGAFEHQALYFANLILDHLKESLTKIERNEQDQARRLHMMTVLNTAVNETTDNAQRMSENDKQNNLDSYIQQLTQQIDEWLAGLELEIPWSQDESFRQVVVNDLAEDIVDRHKYVQLNCITGGTDKDELEYLKYLIFKWINKLVGEEHQETIEHAPELLRRIRSVPVPLLAKSNVNCNSKGISPEFSKTLNQQTMLGTVPQIGYSASKNFQAFPVPIAGPSRIKNPSASTVTSAAPPNMGKFLEGIRVPTTPAIKNIQTLQHLNRMYDDFVRLWVQAIPIPAYTSEETALAEAMRIGLYNGIFQIVTKLRFQPQLLFNAFYYQDALSEELEELLSLLPQTPEFLQHKNQLKALMVEKTTELNELIKLISSPDIFKDKIIHKYSDYVPRVSTNLVKECPLRLYEELQILNIAEDFLLFTKYKEEDPLKAYMFRQKLIERIEELVTEMKRVHGTELKNINPEVYMSDVMEALQQVPLPSQEEIKEEAEEILLGRAIEEWYMTLPLAHNDNLFEQLKRRHLRNALTKKIQNMEKSLIASGNTPEYELRHEISRFLEQIPLGKDETPNINDMVDALVVKVKNLVIPNPQAQALYNTSVNYSGFDENAALHSTTVQVPEGYRLVGPLPPCCAAGLDNILVKPGPSGLQVQTVGASPAGQNLTLSGLMELERQASMIGGGPPSAAQSFGQQSTGELKQNISPAEAKQQSMATPSPVETSQVAKGKALKPQSLIEKNRNEKLQNTNDPLAAAPGMRLTSDSENTQRRASLNSQADQISSHRRPSIGESGHQSGSANGQRRPSMGESEYKAQSKSAGGIIQILHISGSSSGHRKSSMDKLEDNTHSTGENNHSGSVRGQRKPSMGIIGKNTQSKSTQKQTCITCKKDSKNTDEQRNTCRNMLRHDTEPKTECSTALYKVSDLGVCKSPIQTPLCYCNKSNMGNTSGENNKCFCAKLSREKLIKLCSNTETMTETKTCSCKGNKICLCRKTLVSANIEGQTSSQAASNIDGHSTFNHSEYSVSGKPEQGRYFQQQDPGYTDRQSTSDRTEYSVSGKPGQGRYFQQQDPGYTNRHSTFDHIESSVSGQPGQGRHIQQQISGTYQQPPSTDQQRPGTDQQRPGTVYDYDRQRTQDSSTLTNERSLAQTQGLYEQGNVQYKGTQIDKRQDNTLVRSHVPGPTRKNTQDGQMASSALTESDGGGIARDVAALTSTGKRDETEQNRRPSLAQPGSRRLSHRVSIISPQSQERLRLLSETSIGTTDQQDPRGARNSSPGTGSLNKDVGTYESFEGGRPLSSSLREQSLADPGSIEQGHLQRQGENSMPSQGTSAVPIHQGSPMQNFDPRLVSPLPGSLNGATLSNISTPQWATILNSGNQAITKPCVCPPYLSMLSPEQVSMLSSQRTGYTSQMFAPAFSPRQMFQQMIPPGQSPPGMFFGPKGTLPDLNQFRQAPQRMSSLQQSSISQPQQGMMSQPQRGGISQPQQGKMSQSQRGSISQPQQGGISQPQQGRMSQSQRGGISQPQQGGISQPQQGNVSQSHQGMMPPSIFQDSGHPPYSRIASVGHDFPEDGLRTMQSGNERSALMQTIPSEYQTPQAPVERQISMPNRTQILQGPLMEGGQSGVVQITSMIEGNIQTTEEENAPGRTSQAATRATFSQNVQSRFKQDSAHGTSPKQVGEVAQLPAAQDSRMSQGGTEAMQRGQSQGRSLIPTIEENEQQNISVQTDTQRATWKIPQQNVTPLNISQDGYIQEINLSEAGMSQADKRASQAIRRASQGPAGQFTGWQQIPRQDFTPLNVSQNGNFEEMNLSEEGMSQADKRASQALRIANQGAAGQSSGWKSFSPEVAPQNAQIIQPDRTISQAVGRASQSAAGEAIALNYPSISADQASFQQAGPSPPFPDLLWQTSAGLQGPSPMYSPEQQGYQNNMLMAGYISGQPGQAIQDPRAYVQPAAFSTPQRPIPPVVPGRPVKKGKRRHPRKDDGSSESEQRGRFNDGRRLDSDSDSDHGRRIRCRCYERLRRFRMRNKMYEEECDMPCPYAHYYYSCF